MRQKVSLLISKVKTIVNIRNCTIAILIIVGLSIIFAIVIIVMPEPFQRIFPRARESITTLATAAMVFATLLLAYGTFKIIRSDRDRERRDRKERLLNEVIEWATDVSKCGVEKGYPDISNLIDLHAVWFKISNNIDDIILCFKEMSGKNQYIGEIVKVLDQDLREASKTLIDDFEEHIRLLSLCETYMRDREKAWEDVVRHKQQLSFSAKKVIEEATKIKARDIT